MAKFARHRTKVVHRRCYEESGDSAEDKDAASYKPNRSPYEVIEQRI